MNQEKILDMCGRYQRLYSAGSLDSLLALRRLIFP
jgi:hypothetical protein